MSAAKKDTLYIDIDDEITTIIDKVVSSKDKIVALVLPKRATVLQSVVNMKLLKRSSDNAKKKIVLITSETSVLPLAGIAGVHVAKTLQSKPAIPDAPDISDKDDAIDEDVELDKSKSVGVLAGDDEEEVAEVPAAESASAKKAKSKTKKDKKLKIPNFSKFRLRLILGVVILLLLIVGWVMAAKVLPSAEIVIKSDTKTFSKDLGLQAALEPSEDEESETLPAKIQTIEKSDTQTVPATGEKNVGKKAEGTMTLTNCINDDDEHTVPAGTSFTKDGKTFVSTEAITFDNASFNSSLECEARSDTRGNVDVVAVEGGKSFNINQGSYNSSMAGIDAYGSRMKGGTDDIIKVVSQADINKAVEQLKQKNGEGVVDELKSQLTGQGFIAFESSYEASEPETVATESPDSEASSVTVSGKTIHTMVGVQRDAIDQAIQEASKDDIDDSAQAVSDTGLDSATVRIKEVAEGVYDVDVSTTVTAGPQLDIDVLKQEILGKKYGQSEAILSGKAGVVDVDIEYSPFWVNSTPNNPEKVTITVENIAENEQ